MVPMDEQTYQAHKAMIMVPTGEFLQQGHMPSKLHTVLQDLVGVIEAYRTAPKPLPAPESAPEPEPVVTPRREKPRERYERPVERDRSESARKKR